MSATFWKALIKTDTGRLGILGIIGGILEGIGTGDWSNAVEKILIGLGMIFGRHAIMKGGMTTAEFKERSQKVFGDGK